MKIKVIEYAKYLSLDSFIQYLERPNISRQCLHYMLVLTEEISNEHKRSSQDPQVPRSSNLAQEYQKCTANLPVSSQALFCSYEPSNGKAV